MKTMFLTLAAVLGVALGATALSPAANAAWQYTPGQHSFEPANGGNRSAITADRPLSGRIISRGSNA